jgi:hypothetical protein
MSFQNEDPLAGLERDLRANRPQSDCTVGDRIVPSVGLLELATPLPRRRAPSVRISATLAGVSRHSQRPVSEQATVSRPAEQRPGSGRWRRPPGVHRLGRPDSGTARERPPGSGRHGDADQPCGRVGHLRARPPSCVTVMRGGKGPIRREWSRCPRLAWNRRFRTSRGRQGSPV